MIGAVLVELIWTLPLALVVAAVASWYFIRLGGDDVPASRRRVRRLSLVAVMVTIPSVVAPAPSGISHWALSRSGLMT